MLVTTNYFQVDEKTFIPIVNIGSPIKGITKGSRPKEIYIRITNNTLSEVLKSEVTEKRFLDWLSKEVLSSLDN